MKPETELLLGKLMRLMPVKLTSQIGAILGRKEVLSRAGKNEAWVELFYHSIEQISGVSDPAEKRKLLIEFGKQVGRLYAEFNILHRIDQKRLIQIDGIENLDNRTKPSIFVAPHLANWEVIFKVFTGLDNPTCTLYEPRESEQKMAIVNKCRLDWGKNIQLISTSEPMVMRSIQHKLENNCNVFILPDEEKDGYVSAPSLGRTIPYSGNRWMVSRLAVKYSLDVIPMYVERFKSVNFKIHIDKKIRPQTDIENIQSARIVADKIDDVFNYWIRKCPQHWYWMPYLDLNKKPNK